MAGLLISGVATFESLSANLCQPAHQTPPHPGEQGQRNAASHPPPKLPLPMAEFGNERSGGAGGPSGLAYILVTKIHGQGGFMARKDGFPPLNDRRSRARKRALVVDGDMVSRMESRLLLEMQGYEADELLDGLEAINLLDLDPCIPDLVVMDYEMPLLSGLETLNALRALRPGLKALLCIDKGQQGNMAALPEGVAFLGKPFTRQDLSEALDKIHMTTVHCGGSERRRFVRYARQRDWVNRNPT